MGIEAILNWKMTPDEAEAFHIAVVYEEEIKKLVNSGTLDRSCLRGNVIPANGDPRKSILFKNCWKLRRETRGIIEQRDYRFYIVANFSIITHYKGKITPTCITGDKSWIRYKVWKRLYDKKMADISAQAPKNDPNTSDSKIMNYLDLTKKFLFEKCDGVYSYEKIDELAKKPSFSIWVATGKISPYYLVMSKYIEKTGKSEDFYKILPSSASIYKEKITPFLQEYFSLEFKEI